MSPQILTLTLMVFCASFVACGGAVELATSEHAQGLSEGAPPESSVIILVPGSGRHDPTGDIVVTTMTEPPEGEPQLHGLRLSEDCRDLAECIIAEEDDDVQALVGYNIDCFEFQGHLCLSCDIYLAAPDDIGGYPEDEEAPEDDGGRCR